MTHLLRRFRGLAIALAILALSAGAVFAGAPRVILNGAPVGFDEPADPPSADEDGDDDEGADAAAGDEEGTHGAFVSQVAQSETPEGFENHGAYVSCAARLPDEM